MNMEESDKKSEEGIKNNARALDKRYGLVAWGAIFIWIGAIGLVPDLPEGIGWLGIAIILLGLNAARYLNKIPTSMISITIGIIALVMGAAELGFHFSLPLFETSMIVIGVILLIRSVIPVKVNTE